MRRAAVVGLVGGCLLLLAGGSAMARAKTHWRGVKAALPANAATGENQDVSINSISCASAGNCSAVGTYQDSSDLQQGLLLTENRGKWRTGVEAALPGDANPGAYLSSVSCASAGNCAAVGWYLNGLLLMTEKAGTWAGVEAALPANAELGPFGTIGFLYSVSCASAGNCSAVGTYEDSSGAQQGLLLTEKAGRWATGVEAALPANAAATGNAFVNSVSCASAGNCSAVGYYDGDFYGGKGLLLTEKAGTWRTGVEAAMPENAIAGKPVSLTSVSCASAGNCSAVGTYNNDESSKDLTIPRGVLLTETAGRWRAGVKAVPPANSATGGAYQVDLSSVSCPAAGNCVAVGDYARGSGNVQGMLLTEKAGKWSRGLQAARARNTGADHDVQLSSVSCASPGNCTAVDGAGGLLVTETAGRWARAVETALPSNVHVPADVVTVSCPSAGSCSAAGQYGPSGREGLLLDSSAPPCVVPKLTGKTLAAARGSVGSHGCSVGRVEHRTSLRIERDRVISQSPKPGRRLGPGAKVSLVVSRGR